MARLRMWILLLLVLLGVAELALAVGLARITSWTFVFCLLAGMSLCGAWLLRRQGIRAWLSLRSDLTVQRPVAASLADGVAVLAAAVLLMLPGLLSDVAGILLLLPPTSRPIQRWFTQRFQRHVTGRMHAYAGGEVFDHDRIIDAKVIEAPPR